MAEKITKIEVVEYSYVGGGFTYISAVSGSQSGISDAVGGPADGVNLSQYQSPLANAIEQGTQITTPMVPTGLKIRYDDGIIAQPAVAFGPATGWDNGLSFTGSSPATNTMSASINGLAATKWVDAQFRVVAGTVALPGLAGISATTSGLSITATPTVDVIVNAVKVAEFDQPTLPGMKVVQGASGGFAKVGGRIDSVLTDAQSTPGGLETALGSVTVLANTLSHDEISIDILAWGTTAANGNAKTIKLRFGNLPLTGTVLVTNDVTTSPNAKTWELRATIHRTSLGNQDYQGGMTVGAAPQTVTSGTDTVTDTSDAYVELTGQQIAGPAGDITMHGLRVIYGS